MAGERVGPGDGRGAAQKREIVSAAIILLLSLCSWSRNATWHDPVALWSDVVLKSPLKVVPYVNLGSSYAERGAYQEALRYYERAFLLDPNAVDILLNIANAHANSGRPDKAIILYRKAIERAQRLPADVWVNLGNAYSDMNESSSAIDSYRKAMEIDPAVPAIYFNLGVVYERKAAYATARDYYLQALALDPAYAQAEERLREILTRANE